MSDIGARLRQIRKDAGCTQVELGIMSGVSNSFIADIEHGRSEPTIHTLEKILEPLDISLVEFFGGMGLMDVLRTLDQELEQAQKNHNTRTFFSANVKGMSDDWLLGAQAMRDRIYDLILEPSDVASAGGESEGGGR